MGRATTMPQIKVKKLKNDPNATIESFRGSLFGFEGAGKYLKAGLRK